MTKLTNLQIAILTRAADSHERASTWWLSGQIETAHTYRGCRQLERKGLLSRFPTTKRLSLWTITPAGRQALSDQGGEHGG